MSEPTLPYGDNEEVDRLCDAFEAAWKSFELAGGTGLPPQIEYYLGVILEPVRSVLLRELLLIDMPYRRKAGRELTLEQYVQLSPGHSTLIEQVVRSKAAVSGRESPAAEAAGMNDDSWVDGRYRLRSLLGKGTFGEVWKASDTTLERLVALKRPREDRVCDEKRRDLFLAEARKIAALNHPNIVHIFDAVARPSCYLVCEFIEGGSLADRMERGRLTFRESARLVATIAEALHQAHRQNLVHRDVKPGNILLRNDGTPFLTDFGLAVSEKEMLAEPRAILGTFAYMPPEQARGDSNLVDARSDIYSLGVVLYQLLTGRLPFVGKSCEEYQEQILNRPVRPPRTIDDEIPPELEEICLRCLHKQSEQRFKTARDLSRALTEWLNRRSNQILRWSTAAGALGIVVAVMFLVLWRPPDPVLPKPAENVGHFDEEKVDIKPNVYYSMLRWEPKVLTFPVVPSKLDWQPGKPLLVHCTDCGLVVLGKAQRPGYEMRVKLRQETWQGNFGIFLGFHNDSDGKSSFCRYQLFRFLRTTREGKPALLLEHSLAKEYDFGRLGDPHGRDLESNQIDIPSARYCEFSCVVDQTGVHSVTWDGKLLPRLGKETVNAKLWVDCPASFHGEFGIQTRIGTTSVEDYEVRFSDLYCRERKNR